MIRNGQNMSKTIPSMVEYTQILQKLRASGNTYAIAAKLLVDKLEPNTNTSGLQSAIKTVESNIRSALFQAEASVLRALENEFEDGAAHADNDQFAEYYGNRLAGTD